ncbi:MAG TPA: hypothetical protein VLL30_06050, partial [Reyranella sp.]|nr:hypothetical protein [Reyranella sp.]
APLAEKAFTFFWSATFVIYLSETLFCFAIDPVASRKCWFQGVTFPGLVSVAMMAVAVSGVKVIGSTDRLSPGTWSWGDAAALLILAWTGLSTPAAWLVYRIDRAGAPKWLRNSLLVLVGYGPLLCAIAFAAIIGQLRKADLKWDKTIKSGKAKIQT